MRFLFSIDNKISTNNTIQPASAFVLKHCHRCLKDVFCYFRCNKCNDFQGIFVTEISEMCPKK